MSRGDEEIDTVSKVYSEVDSGLKQPHVAFPVPYEVFYSAGCILMAFCMLHIHQARVKKKYIF